MNRNFHEPSPTSTHSMMSHISWKTSVRFPRDPINSDDKSKYAVGQFSNFNLRKFFWEDPIHGGVGLCLDYSLLFVKFSAASAPEMCARKGRFGWVDSRNYRRCLWTSVHQITCTCSLLERSVIWWLTFYGPHDRPTLLTRFDSHASSRPILFTLW